MEQVGTRLKSVLAEGSLARRESAGAVAELEKRIKDLGKSQVIETAAYTWFNRFCALRYMDVNRYTRIGVLSPAEGQFQPEILAEAKMGHVDDEMVPEKLRQKVLRILDESDPSPDPQGEAYRLLLVAVCNYYHSLMPFMFEKIADYTELLLPDDLLSGTSIPAYTREALIPANCSPDHTEESVEVIGWLYQFYISEKKDDVFAALKKGKKITPKNIPAATQLFTPHWIVRYLVENSLGRLWMLNHPNSRLVEQMDYYIKPEEPESDFLKISSPEEIKICDPACGSGHMLTYAFDLLYAIYEEQGYPATDIPRLILTHNLYGIEIDQRAGALAAFALTMKAREKYRRFLTQGKVVQPNICVLENISIDPEDLSAYMDKVGRDLFSGGLQGVVNQWEEADNFGSLIRPLVTDVSEVLELLRERQMGEDLFLAGVHQKVLNALRQADYLSPKYHVAITNPPYKGKGELNKPLQSFMEKKYAISKGDLFACFIERNFDLVPESGFNALVTMQAWLFIDTYKELRLEILNKHSITDLVQIGFNSFPELNSKFALAAAFSIRKGVSGLTGQFITLNNAPKSADKREVFFEELKANRIHRVEPSSFKHIEGTPISFETSERLREVFGESEQLTNIAEPRQGMATGENATFLRQWYEISHSSIGFDSADVQSFHSSGKKYCPYNKGGGFRKWYGNGQTVIRFDQDNYEILAQQGNHLPSRQFYFRECITWSLIGLAFGPRYTRQGFVFDVGGSSAFPSKDHLKYLMAFMASKIASGCLKTLNPTLNYQVGDIKRLPIKFPTDTNQKAAVDQLATRNIEIAQEDWDRQEFSWDFQTNALLRGETKTIEETFLGFREYWNERFHELHQNEEALNRLLMEIYGLSLDMDSAVEKKQIILLDGLLELVNDDVVFKFDEITKEFISYAVGCMLGRYSLDKPGLILANQGDTLNDYLLRVSSLTESLDAERALSEPDTVGFIADTRVNCFSCGSEVPISDGRFVISGEYGDNNQLHGRPLIYCAACCDGKQSSYVTWQQPLENFTVNQALQRKWCEPETLKNFLGLAKCFGHRLPVAPTEVRFLPDEDNVIPLLDGDWFTDDISERFKEFLKVTFGTEHYEENLTFLENALYPDNLTGKKRKTIRDYFLKEFYNHHIKLYKKRPIYWLFSSPKGTFNALIYMHRYRPDTVSVVLGYLRDFRDKLTHHTEHLQSIADRADGSKSGKTKALKQITELKKQLKELDDYERKTLFPLAQKQLPIDLDDGVKVNYTKFGAALKKIPGLDKKEA